MTALLLTCRDATGLLTELGEGSLRLDLRLRLRAHLALCAPCRAFLASLRALPRLLKQVEVRAEAPAPANLESLLQGALARLNAPRPDPAFHPDPALWARAGEPGLALVLGIHLDRCAGCRGAHPHLPALARTAEDPFGPALRAQLPPEAAWRWHRLGLGGGRTTRLMATERGQLHLLALPEGARFPEHAHGGAEAAVILEGRLFDGRDDVTCGDFKAFGIGQAHAPIGAGPGECLVLAWMEGPPRFTGWRRLFG